MGQTHTKIGGQVPRNPLRFIPFQLKTQWGVLDRKTGELIEKAGSTERYPETWARTRADQLNKEGKK
jgi:hypothetical protein